MKQQQAEQCPVCTKGAMAGAIPGTLSNGDRCDTCERYASAEAAEQALLGELIKRKYG